MLKNALIKAVAGTAIAAGGLMVPGVVSADDIAAAACGYAPPATTTVAITDHTPAVRNNATILGTATASAGSPAAPGVIEVSVLTTGTSPTTVAVARSTTNPFSFSFDTRSFTNNRTYELRASFVPDDTCSFLPSSSSGPGKFVTVGNP